MHATVSWRESQQYDALSESGHPMRMDADAAHRAGPSPMETVLMALCGCTAADVVSILRKKREPFTSLTVSAAAEQSLEVPRVFTHVRLIYRVGGVVQPKAMEDAVALSRNKYCSVSKMLEKTALIESVIEYGEDDAAKDVGGVSPP